MRVIRPRLTQRQSGQDLPQANVLIVSYMREKRDLPDGKTTSQIP